ncbi:tetratricopeptide repeat protein [Sphingorhabdus soli]|uniref:Tetratricopeptide repeat protein n=1 Tax=Flavisphingopyxis soli TaxID=2601267 RepID=A0A5C6U7S4_9SPHN|nr:sulfotransferase [Sphingorhabdus soli]TXC69047.1 tetratricopeptide repeat protein [Sphingorhabdus soli]
MNQTGLDREMRDAFHAFSRNDFRRAESIARHRIMQNDDDADARTLLGLLAARLGIDEDAERLLKEALERDPDHKTARLGLADCYWRQGEFARALESNAVLLAQNPEDFMVVQALGQMYAQSGDYDRAETLYADFTKRRPDNARGWLSYAHLLKTIGATDKAIVAYRRSISLSPTSGDAHWSLANLKTFRFSSDEIQAMANLIEAGKLHANDHIQICFALGKAYEDQQDYAKSFDFYQTGNALEKRRSNFDRDSFSAEIETFRTGFDTAFFQKRAGWGSQSRAPIFIVGMPRAGSTLLEQILSSHSTIEGTSELPYIPALIQKVMARDWKVPQRTIDAISTLNQSEVEALAEEYLERSSRHRKTDRLYFIDKLPNNWADIGFIRLLFPNARIIDARRNPMASGFSNFKQKFARGQGFSYNLKDLGRYYFEYVRLTEHFTRMFPHAILRVHHEDVVADLKCQVDRMLSFLDLPFEQACVEFWTNDRAVRTASSEQVRQPINTSGLDQWRNYAPWLSDLRIELGDVFDAYPDPPEFPPDQ